jgi:hypothetical protein
MITVRFPSRVTAPAGAVLVCLAALLSCGCPQPGNGPGGQTGSPQDKQPPPGHPGTEEGARALLSEFLKPGADHAALSRRLRPTKDDYLAAFEPAFAGKAGAAYAPEWDAGKIVIRPNPGQTQLLLSSATTDDLKKGAGNARDFPGDYSKVAAKLKDGLTWYRFKFVAPGTTSGMAYDGLVHVNGNWRIFPKPWRVAR